MQFLTDAEEQHEESGEEQPDQRTPADIAKAIKKWLGDNGVSIAFFAETALKRKQGTLSGLLKYPPNTFPVGAGKDPWEAIKKFLDSSKSKEDAIRANRGI